MKNSSYLPKYLRVKTTLQNLLITLILFACTASFTAEVVNNVKTSTTTNNKLAPKKNTTLTNVQNTVKIGNPKQNKTIPTKSVANINADKQKTVNTEVANNKKVTVANKKIGNKPTQQIVSKKTIVQKKNTIQNNKNGFNTTKVGNQKQDKTIPDKPVANINTNKQKNVNAKGVNNKKVTPKKVVAKNNKAIVQKKTTPKKTNKKNAKKPIKKIAAKKAPIKKAIPKKVRPYYTPSQQKLLDELKKLIPKKIATIDGKEISQTDFYEFFLNSLPARRPTSNVTKEAAPYLFAITLENMVNKIILDKHLATLKIVPNEKETLQYYQQLLSKLSPSEKQIFEARLTAIKQTQDNWIKRLAQDKDIQREICHFNFFQKEIASKITIPESEIRAYYNQNNRRFQHPEYANISAIRVSYNPRKKGDKEIAKQKINNIYNQLVKNPKLFEQLAQKESDCSSKKNGGKLGIIYRYMLHAPIDKVLFTMANNTISKPIEVRNAFYIIKCLSRHGARTLSYNEVKTQIIELLQQQKMHSKVTEFFNTLRKKHKIQIFIKMPPYKDIKMEIPQDAKFK